MRPATFPVALRLRVLSPTELYHRGSKVQLYEVEAPFTVACRGMPEASVPAGFITDFASIPRLVWNIISPEDPIILMASVGHDHDYSIGVDREVADRRMRQAMLDAGAPAWKAWLVYQCVHRFGASHWNAAKGEGDEA